MPDKPRTESLCTASKIFAEFFAGIGLVHRGLQRRRWQCCYANDIEPKKKEMYESEFGQAPYYHVEDVWRTDAILPQISGEPFLATASFPCVDLSLAGHWRGFEGEHSSTYFGFLEVLRRLQERPPRIVMLENVAGFITSRNGNDFCTAIEELAALGYWMEAFVLDASWFLPQSRPRTFVLGFHESLDSDLILRRGEGLLASDEWSRVVEMTGSLRPNNLRAMYDRLSLPTGWATIEFVPPKRNTYKLVDYIDLDDQQDWWSEQDTRRHYEAMEAPSKQRVDQIICRHGIGVGTAFRRTRRGKPRTEVRFDMAGCLRTPKGGSAKQIVVAIDNGKLRMRWMSAREYARLQGAGDFNFTVPPLQAMYGFGDAVCVPVIEWIDETFLSPLYDSVTVAAGMHPGATSIV